MTIYLSACPVMVSACHHARNPPTNALSSHQKVIISPGSVGAALKILLLVSFQILFFFIEDNIHPHCSLWPQ